MSGAFQDESLWSKEGPGRHFGWKYRSPWHSKSGDLEYTQGVRCKASDMRLICTVAVNISVGQNQETLVDRLTPWKVKLHCVGAPGFEPTDSIPIFVYEWNLYYSNSNLIRLFLFTIQT